MRSPGVAARHRDTALILAVGLLGISSGSVLAKLAGAAGVASLTIAAWRLAVASLSLAPIGIATRLAELRSFSRKERALALLSGVFLALHFASWITSLRYTSVASSVVLVSSSPVFVAVLTFVFLREAVGHAMVLGIVLALAGTAIIGWSDWSNAEAPRAFFGDLLALGGAAMIGCHFIAGRILRRRYSTLSYVTAVYPVAAVLLVVAALLSGEPLVAFRWGTCLLLVAVGMVPQVLGHTSFNHALRAAGAPLVALVSVGEPIGASLLALVILGEPLRTATLTGGALVILGILVGAGLFGRKRRSVPGNGPNL
ncbi:MAG: DMT family transporter [Planctomycetota bacterium]